MSKDSLMAAVAAAAGTSDKPIEVTASALKQFFPAVAAQLAAEGAEAERARIQGVEAAALPGHAELINSLKFDGKTQPGEAALAVLKAEKAKLAAASKSFDDDEAKMKGLRSEHGPANGPLSDKPQAAGAGLEGEAKWKAEYGASKELQGEFRAEERYIAFKKAEAAGRVRILARK